MQILPDLLGMPVKLSTSEQTCALGAAMFAAVAGGMYKEITGEQVAMVVGFGIEYFPRPELPSATTGVTEGT